MANSGGHFGPFWPDPGANWYHMCLRLSLYRILEQKCANFGIFSRCLILGRLLAQKMSALSGEWQGMDFGARRHLEGPFCPFWPILAILGPFLIARWSICDPSYPWDYDSVPLHAKNDHFSQFWWQVGARFDHFGHFCQKWRPGTCFLAKCHSNPKIAQKRQNLTSKIRKSGKSAIFGLWNLTTMFQH